MTTTVSIVSITTEDPDPTVAPHRISPDPAFDDLTAVVRYAHDGTLSSADIWFPDDDRYPDDADLSVDAGEGTIFPDDGYFPDDPSFYADSGALTPGVARDCVGIIIRQGGVDPGSGRPVVQRTNRPSPFRVCGDRANLHNAVSAAGMRLVGANVVSASGVARASTGHIASSTRGTDSEGLTYADANDGAGDGPRTEYVYALAESEGWS